MLRNSEDMVNNITHCIWRRMKARRYRRKRKLTDSATTSTNEYQNPQRQDHRRLYDDDETRKKIPQREIIQTFSTKTTSKI